MLKLPRFPVNAIYGWTVALVFLFVIAFLWFITYAVMDPIRTAIGTAMAPYDVPGSPYPAFELADTFMHNLWLYMLAISSFVLLLWIYHYAQRKEAMGI